MEYFGTLNVDPYADPDGDGLCNTDEYLLGTNPTNAYSVSSLHNDAQVLFLAYTSYDTNCSYHLSTTNADTNTVLVTMWGTTNGTNYQIYSRIIGDSTFTWRVETNFIGSNASTTVAITLNGRNLKFMGGYGEDTDGDGLPDGYEVLATQTDPLLPDTGMTGTADGYKDPDGDGYSNLQEMNNGTNPNVWDPPSGPGVLNVVYNSSGTSATLTWSPASGNVDGYTILTMDVQYGWEFVPLTNVPASQASFTDTNSDFADGIQYEVEANYAQGMSLAVDQAPPPTTPLSAALLRGANGSMYLGPTWGGGTNQSETIPITSFTDGLYSLSEAEYPLYNIYDVTVLAITPASSNQIPVEIAYCDNSIRFPFLDGGQVLKDNLIFSFQMQPGVPSDPDVTPVLLGQLEGIGMGIRTGYSIPIPVYAFASFHASTFLYEPYGLCPCDNFDLNSYDPNPEPLHPWEINSAMNDFVYQMAKLSRSYFSQSAARKTVNSRVKLCAQLER